MSERQPNGTRQQPAAAPQQSAARPHRTRPRRANRSEREAIKAGRGILHDEATQKYHLNLRFEDVKEPLKKGDRSPQTAQEQEFLERHQEEQRRFCESARETFGPFATGSAAVERHRQILVRQSSSPFVLPPGDVQAYFESQRDQYFADWIAQAASTQPLVSAPVLSGANDTTQQVTAARRSPADPRVDQRSKVLYSAVTDFAIECGSSDDELEDGDSNNRPIEITSSRATTPSTDPGDEVSSGLKRKQSDDHVTVDSKKVKVDSGVGHDGGKTTFGHISPLQNGLQSAHSAPKQKNIKAGFEDDGFLPMVDDSGNMPSNGHISPVRDGLQIEKSLPGQENTHAVDGDHADVWADRVRELEEGLDRREREEQDKTAKDKRQSAQEFRQFERLQTLLEARVRANTDPFAAPLLELMQFFKNEAEAFKVQNGNAHSYPMTMRLIPDIAQDIPGLSLEDVLQIHSPDTNLPGVGDAWATDNLLQFVIADANWSFEQHQQRSYIAPTSATNMFVRRHLRPC